MSIYFILFFDMYMDTHTQSSDLFLSFPIFFPLESEFKCYNLAPGEDSVLTRNRICLPRDIVIYSHALLLREEACQTMFIFDLEWLAFLRPHS